MDSFNQAKPKYTLPKRPRLFESFAGVGMQRMAFNRLGIDYEMIGISEIDKHAIQSYMAIHGETTNYGDITKIKGEDLPQIDVFTYSFPCQDLSVAGKGRGMQEGTRSGLVFEVLRILRELKTINRLPGLLIMENVTALLNKKHIDGFKQIKEELEELGYTNYVDKLNAKNYGVAQNRDRAWMISVQGDYDYEFPKPIPLEKRLKDYLEKEVDEKYYLSKSQLDALISNSNGDAFIKIKEATIQGYAIATDGDSINLEQPSSKTRRGRVGEGMANTLTTSCNQGVVEPIIVDDIYNNRDARIYEDFRPTLRSERTGLKVIEPIIVDSSFKNSRAPRFYTETCPTINTMGGGNREPKLIEPKFDGTSNTVTTVQKDNMVIEPTINGFYKQALDTFEQNECEYGDTIDAFNMRVNKSGSSPTLTTRPEGKKTAILPITHDLRIRKLTPLECWRLMGIDDEDFHKAKASGVSNSQLYKQAGNGLVVDVFAALIGTMMGEIKEQEEEKEVTMTVKQLIEILSWCDEDKPVKVAKGDKQRDIISTDEDDESVVLIAS